MNRTQKQITDNIEGERATYVKRDPVSTWDNIRRPIGVGMLRTLGQNIKMGEKTGFGGKVG